MRKLLAAVLVTALAGVLAATAFGATRTVRVDDYFFVRAGSPPTIEVAKGTKVKWQFKGAQQHNVHVTSGPKKFTSDLMDSGSFSRKLKKLGTYKIVCDPHEARGMTMTIRVG